VTLEVVLDGRDDDAPVVGTEVAAALLGVSRDTVDGVVTVGAVELSAGGQRHDV
jgi:hypothetical protein